LLLLAWGFAQRRMLVIQAFALQDPPGLLAPSEEGPGARWVDDYFTVERVDERTWAIGEPRYAQQNFSYLILGSRRAVLFDAGPGIRNIRPVADSLTDLPITFVPSHFHYDHLGPAATFESVAVVDLPGLRARAPDGELALTRAEHLGFVEDVARPTLKVTEWLEPGSLLALGERDLLVLYTPGHTEDSISLLDVANGLLFAGDFLYPGPLYAFLPNSRMGDYLDGANAVIAAAPGEARVLGAHRVKPPGVPVLGMQDVHDLHSTLESIRAGAVSGEGIYPVTYPVNERVTLLAEPRWLQRW
jgi:glyoxylase-like metal-dependent hydrolase (beta-lactamase superfamily II)